VRKVEFIKLTNLIKVLFIGFVKQWFSAFRKTNFVFGLSRSTADCSRIFSEPFSQKETALSFFFLLDYASRTCSMPGMYFFCTYLLPNHVKYYLNSQNFPPF